MLYALDIRSAWIAIFLFRMDFLICHESSDVLNNYLNFNLNWVSVFLGNSFARNHMHPWIYYESYLLRRRLLTHWYNTSTRPQFIAVFKSRATMKNTQWIVFREKIEIVTSTASVNWIFPLLCKCQNSFCCLYFVCHMIGTLFLSTLNVRTRLSNWQNLMKTKDNTETQSDQANRLYIYVCAAIRVIRCQFLFWETVHIIRRDQNVYKKPDEYSAGKIQCGTYSIWFNSEKVKRLGSGLWTAMYMYRRWK